MFDMSPEPPLALKDVHCIPAASREKRHFGVNLSVRMPAKYKCFQKYTVSQPRGKHGVENILLRTDGQIDRRH